MLQAAVVGVGMIGQLHSRIYSEDPRTRLVAVVDPDSERAREVADQFGAQPFASVEDMLAGIDVDVVTIATREDARAEPAIACARAGKTLLLEKPLAPSLEDAQALVDAVEATGARAAVNFILRSDPRYLVAKNAMGDGTIGEPCTMYARRRGTALGAEVYGPWTDLLISTAIHDIDAMLWLNDCAVTRVYAESVVKRSAEWGHDDAVMVMLRFDNGCIGTVETSWVLPPTVPAFLDASLHVVGTGGGVVVEGSNFGVQVSDRTGYRHPDLAHWPIGRDGVGGTLRANVAAFIDMAQGNRDPVATLREGLRAERVVAAAKRSIATGLPVAP
jgi:predicted dehydrogenase